MTNPYGPWATAIDAGRNPQLSAFWRQRLMMLVPASQTSPVLSRRNVLLLVAAAFLACMLPTLRLGAASADEQKSAAEKTEAKPVDKKIGTESMQPGFRPLKIQTLDAQGKPLGDADVTVRGTTETVFGPLKYKTNAEGKAVIDAPREDAKDYQILVRKNGCVTAGAFWNGNGNLVQVPEEFTFTLEPGTTFGGLVRDEQGRPVAGAKVTVEGRKSSAHEVRWISIYETVTTDARGKWQVNRVPKDLTGFELSVTLTHPEFGIERFERQKLSIDGLRAQTASFVLRKGVLVDGTVTGPDGKPAAGAAVGLCPALLRSDFPQTKTDPSGRYRFMVNEPGEYTVAAAADGFVPDWKEISVGKDRKTVDLRLGKGERIRLRVVDREGKPLPGIQVSTMFGPGKNQAALMLDYQSLPRNNPAYNSQTDAEGRWSRLWIPHDEITFYIQKQGYESLQKAFAPDRREQVITLEAGVWSASGRVADQETKAPVTKFRVTEGREFVGDNETLWYQSRPVANANGEYRVTWDTPDERRVICIEADGYYASPAQPLGNKGKQVVCNVELKKGENIRGVVRLPDGKALAEVDVVLCTPRRGFSFRNGRVGVDQPALAVRTAADGRFSFPPQNDPCLLVAVHDRGFAQVDDKAAMKEITLLPWARVEGTVIIDGKPAVKETVRIDRSDLWARRLATLSPQEQAARRIFYYFESETDAAGHFVLDRVPPGKANICRAVKLWREDRGTTAWTYVDSRAIELLAGQTLTVHLSGLAPEVIRERARDTERRR